MNKQGRNELGKFAAKSIENRQVRSIRLTDTAWDTLGKIANERSITRADLLESWMDGEYFNLEDKVKQLELELQNIKSSSIQLSFNVLETLDKVVNERSITREELIVDLLTNQKLDIKLANSSDYTQLGLLDVVIEDNSILDSDFINELKVNPLQGKLLALRIGISNSTLSNKKKELSKSLSQFLKWIQSKDPDGIRWISLGGKYSKGYVPADDTPVEKLQLLKIWIHNRT